MANKGNEGEAAETFRAWLAEHRDGMPADIQGQADRLLVALQALKLKQPSPEATAAMRRLVLNDVAAFREAWAAHRSGAH